MDLTDPYIEFWPQLGSEVKFYKNAPKDGLLIKATGLNSRCLPRDSREVYLFFKGDPFVITDTLCTCHGGLRTVGGCAHAVSILIMLGQISGNIAPREPTRLELMLKRSLVLYQNAESSDIESETSDDSDTSRSSDSDSASD